MSKSRYTRLSISFLYDFVSKNGNDRFCYAVTGSPEALALFADAMGKWHALDPDTGENLYYSPKYVGEQGTLLVDADSGKCFPDVSAFRKQASLVKQFGSAGADQSALAKLFSTASGPKAPVAPK